MNHTLEQELRSDHMGSLKAGFTGFVDARLESILVGSQEKQAGAVDNNELLNYCLTP